MRQFDAMVGEKGYTNRSPAIADMIRDQLVVPRRQSLCGEIAGTITLVYDHHKHGLQESLTNVQHDHDRTIISTLHAHLDHHNCLEVLVTRGQAGEIKRMADHLIASKGVKHGKLTITTRARISLSECATPPASVTPRRLPPARSRGAGNSP